MSRTHESSAEFDAAARARSRLWLGTGLSFGASVVSAALGAALGLNAYQAWAERDRHCRPGCDLDAVRAGERAEQSARWSNVAFVVSAASGGGGLLLWSRAAAASRGSSQSSAGVVAVEPMMLSVKGSF